MARSFEVEVPSMTVLAVCVWQAVSNASTTSIPGPLWLIC